MARIAIVTDEISGDPITAVELGLEWGVRRFELRSVSSGRLPFVSDADLRKLDSLARRGDIELTVMSPGFFKAPLDSDVTRRQLEEGLPRAIELAHRLGVPKIDFFAGRKESGIPRADARRKAADLLRRCAEALADADLGMLLENEHICWADTGTNAKAILDLTDHPNMALNWDPCNVVWAGGSPFPREYALVKPHIGHLHIKDTARGRSGRFHGAHIGEGEVGWGAILRAFVQSGWDRLYTVETHFEPKVAASRRCVHNLRRLLIEAL